MPQEVKECTRANSIQNANYQPPASTKTYRFKDLTPLFNTIFARLYRIFLRDKRRCDSHQELLEKFFLETKEKEWKTYNTPLKSALVGVEILTNAASLIPLALNSEACATFAEKTGWGKGLIKKTLEKKKWVLDASKFIEQTSGGLQTVGKSAATGKQSFLDMVDQCRRDQEKTHADRFQGRKSRREQDETQAERRYYEMLREKEEINQQDARIVSAATRS